MRRIPLFSAVAALALLAAAHVTPASAGQLNSAGTNQYAGSHAFARGGSPFQPGQAHTISTALSTALSVGGDTRVGTKGPISPLSSAPAVQVGVGAAVALDGTASALAANRGSGSEVGGR